MLFRSPDEWHLAGLLPVGWPMGNHGPVRRKPVEHVTYVDRWDAPIGTPDQR